MWGRPVVAVMGAAACAMVTVAPAHATPEQDYLDVLYALPGFTVDASTTGPLTDAGNAICADLRGGQTSETAAEHALTYPGSSLEMTRLMVAAAEKTLCPDTLQP
jgi:hypothetical protein